MLLLLFALVLPAGVLPAGAQSSSRVDLAPPQIDQFPLVTTYIDLRDAQGRFMHGLQPHQVTILEDDVALTVNELEQLDSGAQFVLVLNPGLPFAIHDTQGNSRYDRLVQNLKDWSDSHSQSYADDLSLLITNGPEALHLTDAQDWYSVLENFQSDFRKAVPGLEVLTRAIEVAADSSPRPGMGRVVLFITPPLDGEYEIGLQTLTARAVQTGIKVCVWLVASPEAFYSRGSLSLASLAEETGGAYLPFSGVEPLPDLEEYLDPLRNVYRVSYDSKVTHAGEHLLVVEIDTGADKLISPGRKFIVQVMPPNPILVSLPTQIQRSGHYTNQKDELEIEPATQRLEMLVEFPDGYSRELSSSFLYIDGAIVAENTEPPFDSFSWNLQNYLENGNHTVQVQVIDVLGISGKSNEANIAINVQIPKKSILMMISRQRYTFAGVAVVLSGGILLLVLVIGGRIRPAIPGRGLITKDKLKGQSRARLHNPSADPVTQPVKGADIRPGQKGDSDPARGLPYWINRLQWPQRHLPTTAYANLTRLSEGDQSSQTVPISITADSVTIGRDPFKATLVLDDPSIDPLHASLQRENGSFRLRDQGSVAGTWVNYTPVSREGTLLENGDLIHIGRLGFRFWMRDPGRQRKPVVIPKEPLP